MKHTIRSSREIDAMFRDGTRAAVGAVVVLATRRSPERRGPVGRVAVIAGRKLGGAVARNRAKRVLRESSRRVGAPWPGWDVTVLARPGAGQVPPAELDRDLRAALARAGVVAG